MYNNIRYVIYFTCSIVFDDAYAQNWRDRGPNLRIDQGVLEGRRIYTESGKVVNAFLGIPYASPPLAEFRFAPPQTHPGWTGIWNSSDYGPSCPQLPIRPGITDQEDCLYLNIWTPDRDEFYAPLPVVIFFEGKNFAQSSEIPMSGEDLAAQNVVVVTVNYRLNIFGFFCLGTSEARGNSGLLDQYFAVLWVKNNIKQFGGDPEKITLYGHQSGAVSVVFHMVSPRTAGLFQRAVLSSGSAFAPWQEGNDPVIASKQILRVLGCDSYTTNSLKCLRSKKVDQILQALGEYYESYTWNDKFLPVVDSFLSENNRYLPVDPALALKQGTYLQVPVLTGISKPVANEQFAQWLEMASQGYPQLYQYTEKAKIPEIIRLYRFGASSKEQISDLIKWKYFTSTRGDVRALYEQLKLLEFEAKIEAPHFSQLYCFIASYVQPIYVYYMDDIGFELNTTDATITTDLLLLFGPILLKQMGRRRFGSNELNLSRQFRQMWMNFIIFGNPTPNNQVRSWRKYTSDDNYIETFGLISHETNKELTKTIAFWNNLLPKIATLRNNFSYIPKELQNSPAGFRHAMYTLVALVIALLGLLLICIMLLKRRSKERDTQLHMGY